jgi:hypothetical protein
VEWLFSELRVYGVLRSSHASGSRKFGCGIL